MKPVSLILFAALVALSYARSYDDVKEEIKNEVENEILNDLEEENDELDDNAQEVNDPRARRWRRAIRRMRLRQLEPLIRYRYVRALQAGKK
uniref:Arminin 03264 n=1 Tax=Hydra vulgaris TaxID=6087 RepID=R9UFK1_HYDVU|nr:arminin 03264 [Hydra vulgaris]